MPMDRTAAAAYLATRLDALWAAVAFTVSDPVTDLAEIVDDALLAFGVSYGDLATAEVADADVPGFRAVLRLAGLRVIRDMVLHRVDVTISDPSVSKKWSQMAANLRDVISAAEAECGPFLATTADFETGAIIFGDRPYPPGVEPWLVAV